MNPYLNVLMSLIILYFSTLLYNQYKLHEKWNDDVEHYDLVNKFLEKKINFQELNKLIKKISNLKEFQKFKKIKPRNLKQIYNLRDYVHLKLNTLGI